MRGFAQEPLPSLLSMFGGMKESMLCQKWSVVKPGGPLRVYKGLGMDAVVIACNSEWTLLGADFLNRPSPPSRSPENVDVSTVCTANVLRKLRNP